MKKSIVLIVVVFLAHVVYSQEYTFKGKVVDEKGQPLEFATVGILPINKGGQTNSEGAFSFQLSKGSYTVKVYLIGFKTLEQKLELTSNTTLEFSLFPSDQLEEVVVSGTLKEMTKLDSPIPVEVYSPKFFKANPAPSIFESMQNVNGVRPQLNCNVCNTGDIHINGLEGPYTMVLIDGMPIVSGLSTVYGLTGIPQSLIERVEVVKGPASTLYGSEAVGGLINVITKNTLNAPSFSFDTYSSNWGDVNTDVGVKFTIKDKVTSLLGVNYFNYQNPIDKNNDGFTDMTLQNRISVFDKISVKRKSGKQFSVAGRYVYEDRWGGDMKWTPQFRGGDSLYGESIFTSRWETFGVYQLPTKEHFTFQYSANGHQQNSVYGTTVYNAEQYIGFGQLTWNKGIKQRHDFLAGIAYRYTYYNDNTSATIAPSIIHLPGIFMQDEYKMNLNNKLLFGLRYDINSIHGHIFTPRVNYKWNSDNLKNVFRVGIGNGYRVANVFTEDHAALTGARQVEFASELKPETSWNGNINYVKKIYTTKNTLINIDVSSWYTYFTNRILPDYETHVNKIIYDNLSGYSVSKGVSVNVDVSWAKGLKAIVGGTLMDVSVVEDGVKTRQLLTEKASGVWNIGYTFHKAKVAIDYTGNVYGPMRLPLLGELDDRPAYSPWYSIQNIQLTKTLGNWEVYGGVKNILNYTPPANSIARSFDPFDKQVVFDQEGNVIPTTSNPNALTFDPTYVFASNQGVRFFMGVRYSFTKKALGLK